MLRLTGERPSASVWRSGRNPCPSPTDPRLSQCPERTNAHRNTPNGAVDAFVGSSRRKADPPDVVDLVLMHLVVGAVCLIIILVSIACLWVAS